MKLTEENKKRIDDYFSKLTHKELLHINEKYFNKPLEAINYSQCCKQQGTVKIMDKKQTSVEIRLIKKGTDPELKTWVEMHTVNDIFQQALLLNKKDRKKLFKEFALMTEQSVLYKKACDELINQDSKLELESFKWCND